MARFLSIDPCSNELPDISPYTYAVNSPLLLIDGDGEFPIKFYLRSFAPFALFGGSNWVGDNRGFSTSTVKDVRSRLALHTFYETTTRRYWSKPEGSVSTALFAPGTKQVIKTPWLIGAVLNAESEAEYSGGHGQGNRLTTHLFGNDDAVIGGLDGKWFEDAQSPDIDVHYDMKVIDKKRDDGTTEVTISGVIKGDGFPAAEMFAEIGGATVFLAAAPAQHGPNHGPFISLLGDGQDHMANIRGTFVLDKNNKFMGAVKNGKLVSAGTSHSRRPALLPRTKQYWSAYFDSALMIVIGVRTNNRTSNNLSKKRSTCWTHSSRCSSVKANLQGESSVVDGAAMLSIFVRMLRWYSNE